MNISIAMATYNGAKYLQEQLDSFATQTLLPDELVVCDDGSTDQTLEIIENFSRTVAFNVRVYRNKIRLGFVQNFGRAMSLCTGDVVFLSDQDDYWFFNKIETVAAIFKERPNAWVVINDAEITDEKLKPTGLTIISQIHSAGLNDDEHNHGCCSSYRKNFSEVILPMPDYIVGHDIWLHFISLSFECRELTIQPLQFYRRHSSNHSEHITSNTSRISKLMLFSNLFSHRNLRQNPVDACNNRLLQLNSFRQRIKFKKDFLLKNFPFSDKLEKSLLHIEKLIFANENRKKILLKNLPSRLASAIYFYLTGGYKNFEGIKSFAKDVLR